MRQRSKEVSVGTHGACRSRRKGRWWELLDCMLLSVISFSGPGMSPPRDRLGN